MRNPPLLLRFTIACVYSRSVLLVHTHSLTHVHTHLCIHIHTHTHTYTHAYTEQSVWEACTSEYKDSTAAYRSR